MERAIGALNEEMVAAGIRMRRRWPLTQHEPERQFLQERIRLLKQKLK
jgi:hypothetical protein